MKCKHELNEKGWCIKCNEYVGRKSPTFFKFVGAE